MSIIDNEKKVLVEELRGAMSISKRIDIAVGYFFVSGFAQIMNCLGTIEASDDPRHKMRILMSPVTDRATLEALYAGNEALSDIAREAGVRDAPGKTVALAADSMIRELEHMPQTDLQGRAVRRMIELIARKKIEVRVYTREQLHAKLYLFELDQHTPQESIIGSSNFSISGIKTHAELNLLTHDDLHYREFQKWYETHWDDPSSMPFTEEISKILGNSWAGRTHTPKDVAGKASVHENPKPVEAEPGRIQLYEFQREAVGRAVKKINDYGGVIIADVVGTGKTYMGAAILIHLLNQDVRYPLIICPARLEPMWNEIKKTYGIACSILSNSKLNRLHDYDYCDAILIDESHAFKDHRRVRYRRLSEYMEGRTSDTKMIMLTATPISNTVLDLKNQLKLFPQDMMERIPALEEMPASANKTKLDAYFEGVEDDERHVTPEGRERIRELLRHVLIRRTRKRILDSCPRDEDGRPYIVKNDTREYFPESVLHNLEYDAEKTYEGNFEAIETVLAELTLGRYTPGNYVRDEYMDVEPYNELQSMSLGGIVRVSLLKRLESSIAAFDSSVRRYRSGHMWFLDQLKRDRVSVGKDFGEIIRKLVDNDSDDVDVEEDLKRTMEGMQSRYEAAAFDMERWIQDVSEDIRRFDQIGELLKGKEFAERDDKLHRLLELVNGKQEKLLIFTESAVTAEYIYGYLKDNVAGRKMRKLDSSLDKDIIRESVDRFAPEFNNADYDTAEQIEILVSTDILAEGLNLQAGRVIVNYDFHWNPVRLIQRIGRIDRLGSRHREIEVHNFLTAPKVEGIFPLREIVRRRIDTIRNIVGTGSRVLESTEPLDTDDVCDIYDRKKSVLDPRIGRGILDQDDDWLEEFAERIRRDGSMVEYYEGLQYGIRASAGSRKLLIACSAEDTVADDSSQTVTSNEFRRYYEVTEQGVKSIRQSSFLRQVTAASNEAAREDPARYNEFVALAWDRFKTDRDDSARYVPMYKFQRHFDRELSRNDAPGLRRRVMTARRFVMSRMMQNRHPYTDLKHLYNEAGRENIGGTALLERLEKIQGKYDQTRFRKTIRKPRILYSMMVNA